jgi:hypothetical protein
MREILLTLLLVRVIFLPSMHNTIDTQYHRCQLSMPTMSEYAAIDLCSSSDGSEGNNHSRHSVVDCCSESSYSDFVLPPYQTSSSSSSSSVSSSPESRHSFLWNYLSDDSPFIPESADCCDSSIESLEDDSWYRNIIARRPQRRHNR